ncbi:hypothetical protein ACFL2H_05315 [Planctomycetota bacterium]
MPNADEHEYDDGSSQRKDDKDTFAAGVILLFGDVSVSGSGSGNGANEGEHH